MMKMCGAIKGSSDCTTCISKMQLFDMPNEIFLKILSFFSKTELSIVISNTSIKFYELCQTLLNGKLTILDYEWNQSKGMNLKQKTLMEWMECVLENDHIIQPISYCIFHFVDYWTTDPRSLESTYEPKCFRRQTCSSYKFTKLNSLFFYLCTFFHPCVVSDSYNGNIIIQVRTNIEFRMDFDGSYFVFFFFIFQVVKIMVPDSKIQERINCIKGYN